MVDKDARPLAQVPEVKEWAQRQLVTTTCAFCGEGVEALVPQAAAWFAEHRRIKHPDVPEPERHNRDRSRTHSVDRPIYP
jgi:hypothetical protein